VVYAILPAKIAEQLDALAGEAAALGPITMPDEATTLIKAKPKAVVK